MRDAARWVEHQASSERALLVGYPVVFDWLFLHWYFVAFLGDSPFGLPERIPGKRHRMTNVLVAALVRVRRR